MRYSATPIPFAYKKLPTTQTPHHKKPILRPNKQPKHISNPEFSLIKTHPTTPRNNQASAYKSIPQQQNNNNIKFRGRNCEVNMDRQKTCGNSSTKSKNDNNGIRNITEVLGNKINYSESCLPINSKLCMKSSSKSSGSSFRNHQKQAYRKEEKLKKQLQNAVSVIELQQSQIVSLEEEKKILASKLSQLTTVSNSCNQISFVCSSEESRCTLDQELSILRRQYEVSQNKLHEQLKATNNAIQQQNKYIKNLEQRIQQLINQFQIYEQETTEEQETYKQQIKNLQFQKSHLMETISQLEDFRETHLIKISSLETKIDKLCNKIRDQQKKQRHYNKQYQKLMSQIKQLEDLLEKKQGKFERMREAYEREFLKVHDSLWKIERREESRKNLKELERRQIDRFEHLFGDIWASRVQQLSVQLSE